MSDKSILIIYTGGTIGMLQDPETGALAPLNLAHITDQVSELKRFGKKLDVITFDPIVDSSNMNPDLWVKLAKLIESKYEQHDGFVILHGSDTMAYSASALSFLLENLSKPVIFTGSQLPIGELRTDAKENLLTAIEIALLKKKEESLIQEVCIYFDYQLFRGNRSRKFNSAKFEAFTSTNYPPLAEAGVHLNVHEQNLLKNEKKELVVRSKMDNSIAVLHLYPGINQEFANSVCGAAGIRSIVLSAFGAGNAPTDKWFINLLHACIKKGINIVDITQCNGGRVELGRYETSRELKKIGVISGHDMTFEATIAKLMYLQGQFEDQKKVAFNMEVSLRGELTKN